MTEEQQRLYKKVYGGYINTDSTKSTVDNYTKLASSYEEDFVGLGYDTPKVLAEAAFGLLKPGTKNQCILDLACGTGLVAKFLKSCGFEGVIDGNDGSSGMLELAKKSGFYRDLVEEFIVAEKRVGFGDNLYDGVVCCGGFGPGHIMPDCLGDVIRVAKPGGVIVFATRYNEIATPYVTTLEREIERLEKEGSWSKERVFTAPYFSFDASDSEKKQLLAKIYCYRKN